MQVIKSTDQALECQEWGNPRVKRKVAKSQVKVLRGPVPQSLVDLNKAILEIELPLRNPARWKDSAPRHDTSWKDLMSDINVEPTAKRPRILAIEFQAKPDADRSGTDSQTVGRGADLYNDGLRDQCAQK
eukprot:Platyproteum_vivax@DN7634_c1_g4_i3.p1